MTTLDPADLVHWLTRTEDPKRVPPVSPEELMAQAASTITALKARIERAVNYIQHGADPEYGDVDTTALTAILTGEQQPADIAAQLCGDYPAPCNCDDPVNHGGRKRDFPSWLTRQDANSLTPEQLDYVNSGEFERDRS